MRGRCAPIGIVGQAAAGPRVLAASVAMRRGQRLRDLGARAETSIDQSPSLQRLEGIGIGGGAFRLNYCHTVVAEAEPIEVLENPIDELRTATAGIEILDPQQELPAAGSRQGMAQGRRIGVPQVKPSRRRGGETCDLQDSLHGKGDNGDS
jgi:hypothetical protein